MCLSGNPECFSGPGHVFGPGHVSGPGYVFAPGHRKSHFFTKSMSSGEKLVFSHTVERVIISK